MATQITNYQCPACTGPLHFMGGSGRLECEYCGSTYSVAEVEALYADKEAAAAAAAESRNADWNEEAVRAYSCPSCGAELLCEATTAATSCPYCGNPTVVPGQFAGARRPDCILPFRLDKEAAVRALKGHCRKNPFLPRAFTSQQHLEEVKGVYVHFWLYAAHVVASGTFRAENVSVREEGDYRVSTIMQYEAERSGSVSFTNVPADGSKKMPDDYMDSIEPFDYSDLKPFSTAYLPGFLADRYDMAAAGCRNRAARRCKTPAAGLLEADVTGYTAVHRENLQTTVRPDGVRGALLPVWLLSTRWNRKTWLFAMNGQTGKFVGELPVSNGKFWAMTGILTALFSALAGFSGIARRVAYVLIS